MLFNSFQFLLFFTIIYVLYLLLKHRWQNKLLVAASCLFYASWSWKFLLLMLISITTDYFCSQQIYQSTQQNKKRGFLFLSIFINLAILGFFKYFNFFTDNVIHLLKHLNLLGPSIQYSINIVLPLGISFYTFEAISYTVDVYRKEVKPAQKYTDYLLFVIYFPHLIAGPIMRAKNFLPQITTPRILTLDSFYEGCYLFFWGIFEKLFVADNLARIVNPIFALKGPYEGSDVLLALYAFSFQIFCDFDGYSNMARGLGKCMGFDITINFKLPYFALNPREFWQRWHISLSTWLRDYIYIPLGGNRNGPVVMYSVLLLTMLLGGFWHGASWTFVFWGAYHGMLLIIYRLCNQKHKQKLKYPILRIIFFFHLILLGWLFFRAQSIVQVIRMVEAIIFNFKIETINIFLWIQLSLFIAPILAMQIWQARANDLMVLYKQHWILKTILYAFMTYLIIGWGVIKSNEFIYFQF